MATAIVLDQQGVLHRYDPGLEVDEQELRLLYASDKLRGWLQNELSAIASEFGIELAPIEQFDTLIATYASGLPLVFDRDFKAFVRRALQPIGDGVWYLKTQDLRIFGWFWKKDCFIGVVADTAARCKTHQLYQGYRGEVIRFRDQLDLDEPKFIASENPDDVIFNYDLPA
jgi:hypothetical protein